MSSILSQQESLRYSRQILLPDLKLEGQEKLKSGSALVIGAGGLGSPALYYLTAAGVGKIGILDFDVVDVSNLQRQILYSSEDVGSPKATKAAERLSNLNPHIKIETHQCFLNSENALETISNYDVVIDGSDNLPTRYLVNDACVLLNKTLIYGAIFQFEGQVSVFNELLLDGSRGPNYRDLFPIPPPPEMVPSCSEGGVLGVLPGIIGSMQANEAIKVLAGIGTTLSGRLLLFDALDFSTRYLKIKTDSNREAIKELIDYEQFCNPKLQKESNEISPSRAKELIASKSDVQIIDVREPFEFDLGNIGGVNIPLKVLDQNLEMISKDKQVVVLCKSGGRSSQAVTKLQELGYSNVMNLSGGLLQWKKEVDSTLVI
ncbi:MAG: molybdopterin-synthase adenylyltransferase MoeB [Cyclobacteriaceae bacterium]